MKKVESKNTSKTQKKIRPALSPEAREKQLISMATDLAEQQLLDGTASSQVITHFLKQGTYAKKLELEKLETENRLLTAKTEAIQSSKRTEELISDALEAMRRYSGRGGCDDYNYND